MVNEIELALRAYLDSMKRYEDGSITKAELGKNMICYDKIVKMYTWRSE